MQTRLHHFRKFKNRNNHSSFSSYIKVHKYSSINHHHSLLAPWLLSSRQTAKHFEGLLLVKHYSGMVSSPPPPCKRRNLGFIQKVLSFWPNRSMWIQKQLPKQKTGVLASQMTFTSEDDMSISQWNLAFMHLYITLSPNTPDHMKFFNFTVSAPGHLGIIITAYNIYTIL